MPTKPTDFPRDVASAIKRYGVREGHSHRETDPDYRMVLDVPGTGPNDRLAVCKDGIQIIHQRKAGGRWRNMSFYASESGLKRGLSAVKKISEGSPTAEAMGPQPEFFERRNRAALIGPSYLGGADEPDRST